MELNTMHRLVSAASSRVTSSAEGDKLTTKRAYSLFSRVVTYSDCYKGIQSINLLADEAVATVQLPSRQPTTCCKRIQTSSSDGPADICLQTTGLLVNSNADHLSADQVAVMTGLDRLVVPSFFGRTWDRDARDQKMKVYARFDFKEWSAMLFSFKKMKRVKKENLIAAFYGCRFGKVLIAKLAKVLDSASGGATVSAPTSSRPAKVEQQQKRTLDASSASPKSRATILVLLLLALGSRRVLLAAGSASISSTGGGSDTGESGYNTPASEVEAEEPDALDDGGEDLGKYEALKGMIAEHAGLGSASEVADDVMLADMGLDSLASIELAEQLASSLGVAVDSGDLGECTLKDLTGRMGISLVPKDGVRQKSVTAATTTATQSDTRTPSTPSEPSHQTQQQQHQHVTTVSPGPLYALETLVYKQVDDIPVHADVYFPKQSPGIKMPIALMIHGGGHMTLSRKSVRPQQTAHLLAHNILPVSIDYRLCPEIDLVNGPMADVRSAYEWCQTTLPQIAAAPSRGITIDPTKIVVIGWSTGGQLAISLGWTLSNSHQRMISPPRGILSFYAPYDFAVTDELDQPREWAKARSSSSSLSSSGPKPRTARGGKPLEQIAASLPKKPITSYHSSSRDLSSSGGDKSDDLSTDEKNLGWLRTGDERSELVLSMFTGNGNLTKSLLLRGWPDAATSTTNANDSEAFRLMMEEPLPRELVESICPISRVQKGEYKIPTFVIHGTADEIAPFGGAERFVAELERQGVKCGFLRVQGGKHVHDIGVKVGSDAWKNIVGPGYNFLFETVNGA